MWYMDLVALRLVGSFWVRDRTCVSCMGRQILYHLSYLGSPIFKNFQSIIYNVFINHIKNEIPEEKTFIR